MIGEIKADRNKLHGFKVRLYPDDEQKSLIKEMSDLYKFVFNRTLERSILESYDITKSEFEQMKEELKDEDPEFSLIDVYQYKKPTGSLPKFTTIMKELRAFRNSHEWMKVIPINTCAFAVRNVLRGYDKFFRGHSRRPGRFKTNHGYKQTFGFRGARMTFLTKNNLKYVKIEGIKNPILVKKTMTFPICDNITKYYYKCIVTYDGLYYWLSFETELYQPVKFEPQEGPIGIDLGMRQLMTLSDGTVYYMPDTSRLKKRRDRASRRMEKDIRRRQEVAKRTIAKYEEIPESKNAEKRRHKYRKLCNKIKNIKHTFIHTATKQIVDRHPSAVVMETLQPRRMSEKHNGRSSFMREYLFATIRDYMEYKCKNAYIPFIAAPSDYPSTQLCSRCGKRHKVFTEKLYVCPYCGLEIDRDLNAALNLRSLATDYV